jgi:hypothetical protein
MIHDDPREAGDVAAPRRGDERVKQALLFGVADAGTPSICDMLARARRELTRVGLFEAQDFADLSVRAVEGFAQHVVERALGSCRVGRHEDLVGDFRRVRNLHRSPRRLWENARCL